MPGPSIGLITTGTAHPLQRLHAVRDLVDAGIDAGVLMVPIVPGFSSSRGKIDRTMKAIADDGARASGPLAFRPGGGEPESAGRLADAC